MRDGWAAYPCCLLAARLGGDTMGVGGAIGPLYFRLGRSTSKLVRSTSTPPLVKRKRRIYYLQGHVFRPEMIADL